MYDEEEFGSPVKTRGSGRMWIECRKCRSTMFSTFDTCWSCGAPMTEKNSSAVRF
ncbi:MAG: hypothetical protein V1934_00940 [Methanobacteriota archaeon]